MAVQWTREQEQVIHLDHRNILVSAAAGSGKTAVLVERIVNRITRKEDPVDIDRLLVVTFTRAAAGEMRERLAAAVERRLEEEPDNEHLQRQQTLIHNAQINTIDGFCSYVIRNYFHTIDLDPGFRTANEGEVRLMKTDVVQEILETAYEKKEEKFHRFVECLSSGKTDEGLGDLILQLYEFSMSNPWPGQWLRQCREMYRAENVRELMDSAWMAYLWKDVGNSLKEAGRILEENESLVKEEDGPGTYGEAIAGDRLLWNRIWNLWKDRNFDGCVQELSAISYTALSRKKDPGASEEKKEMVKTNRDRMKEIFKELRELYFYGTAQEILEELHVCREPVEVLTALTEAFMDAYREKKRQKNLVDFSDMEHFALEILVKQGEDGDLEYTSAAEEFSGRFEEILIDEYQDSNLVQETLLTSVSRLRFGVHNIFMVGDVKQSIYRFRLARPELFMEKYDSYTLEDSDCQRIDLHRNFRSRAGVLEGINYIFRQIMGKSLGDVEYDQAAALYPGAVFPPGETGEEEDPVEVLMVETDAPETADDSRESTALEMEARMVGERILDLVKHHQVLDPKTGTYRNVRYRDCVVLLRTMTGWGDVFVRVLMHMGIPAHTTSRTGYFSALEVVTVLNYLRICDNPMQEIPFAAVLSSPIGGCSPEELAWIKGEFPRNRIYQGAEQYARSGTDPGLRKKLQTFFQVYREIRQRVSYTPIHRLIPEILEQTGYGWYARAMPGGEQRKANLDMLVEKAVEFETTSYRGLFHFIRYIENLQKYQVDFGERSTVGEQEDTVRIMSIHKSKGLEFPVVFVSGMGKRFNMTDANAPVVMHPDLGIGTGVIIPEKRIKAPSLVRQVIRKQIRLESLGEELRVLYVAMTRAKEKLILTGSIEKLEQKAAFWYGICRQKQERLSYGLLENAQSYWAWVLPALARHPAFDRIYQDLEKIPAIGHPMRNTPANYEIVRTRGLSQVEQELAEQMCREERKYQLLHGKSGEIHRKMTRILDEHFSFAYPFGNLQDIPAVLSVSQLKEQEREEFQGEELFPTHQKEAPLIPEFMREKEERLEGSYRGTAYHQFLEGLDYGRCRDQKEIEDQLEEMTRQGKLTRVMADSIRPGEIFWYARSLLGRRMGKAQETGTLHREQPFVMEIPASEKNPEWSGEETILVQGVIDAFFPEGDGLVLVDYKTDYVPRGQEQLLLDKYRMQLDYYREALERITGKRVIRAEIYSFSLGKAVTVPEKEVQKK